MIHVLPGDAVSEQFRRTSITGEVIVCRECLIVGDISSDNADEFWANRSKFIVRTHGETSQEYLVKVKSEFDRLISLSETAREINLWFEYELFCQVNYWFCISLLQHSKAKIFRVAPVTRTKAEIWKGFGEMGEDDLKTCLENRVELTTDDIEFGAELWNAYRRKEYPPVAPLALLGSNSFPFLEEVCIAAIRIETWPADVLKEIIASGKTEFAEIFQEFSERLGVYGFGDSQFKEILKTI